MPLPLAVWAAAGLGAAGVSLYKNMTNAKAIVKETINRYTEERYKFYKEEEKLLPLISELGLLKLAVWKSYGRMFTVLDTIENKPGHYSFRNHLDVHMLPANEKRLKKIGITVEELHQNKLDRIGTGLLTAIALHGGAVNSYNEIMQNGQKKDVPTILETISANPMDSDEYGELEELAVLKALMNLPAILGDEAFEEIAAEKMTKEEALKFKHKIDNRSLILADGGGKLQRLHDVLVSTIRIMKNLNQQYLERIVYLEKLVKVRNDYKEFSLEEKDNLNFCVVLGHALRQVARTDMVLKNGDVSVINNAEIYAVYDEIHDLLPAEEPLNY
jgi:hypothetical protein